MMTSIKPIRTDADLEDALKRFEKVMFAKPGTPDYDEMEVLGVLIEDYESKHHAIEAPSPRGAIRTRMEERGLRPVDLVPLIGSPSKVSEVLAGKRNLSLRMIRRLSEGLDLPLETLIPVSAT